MEIEVLFRCERCDWRSKGTTAEGTFDYLVNPERLFAIFHEAQEHVEDRGHTVRFIGSIKPEAVT